jgi:NADPH2:quinone reductase
MTPAVPQSSLTLRSLVTEQGTLELSLTDVDLPALAPGQVLLQVQAAPINPSDLGLLLAGADMATASTAGTPDRPVVTAPLPEGAIRALAARVGTPMPVGNEGAGTVVAAGDSPEALALLGRTVSVAAGGMYTQYRICEASLCLALPEDTPARVGASAFVNPLTTLGMIETMRREGHSALVHTAAASNLGQMLVKLCQEENVPLVNIVRRPKQERICDPLGLRTYATQTHPRSGLISQMHFESPRPRSASMPLAGGSSPVRFSAAWRRQHPPRCLRTRGTDRRFASRSTSTEDSIRARPC